MTTLWDRAVRDVSAAEQRCSHEACVAVRALANEGLLYPADLVRAAPPTAAEATAEAKPARHLIVVDVESNGLDLARHQPVEVAWWNLTTDERATFIPAHDVSKVLAAAELEALRINRYVDRIAGQPQADQTAVRRLWEEFRGSGAVGLDPEQPALPSATLVGANPRFDAAMLRKLAPTWGEPWHHRLWDVSAYAAGVLGLDELPGLARVCELLDVPPPDHTAEGDVTATGLCIRKLQARAAFNREVIPF